MRRGSSLERTARASVEDGSLCDVTETKKESRASCNAVGDDDVDGDLREKHCRERFRYRTIRDVFDADIDANVAENRRAAMQSASVREPRQKLSALLCFRIVDAHIGETREEVSG
jgi:hypothetical protein